MDYHQKQLLLHCRVCGQRLVRRGNKKECYECKEFAVDLHVAVASYVSVSRCMPIARLGLIHNTMPSHFQTPFSKSLVNVWRVYVRVTKGGLKACVCVNARIYNNGGLKVG